MNEFPDHDPGDMPDGFRDPVAAVELPWITAYDPEAPDPCPPADRLAVEPETVEVEV